MKYEHRTLASCIRNRSAWPGPGGIDDNNALIVFKKKINVYNIINTRNNGVPQKYMVFSFYCSGGGAAAVIRNIVPLHVITSFAYFKTQV